jgi:non-canonical purine NTP pyrophosphatase (RdgB/HAM1 family)
LYYDNIKIDTCVIQARGDIMTKIQSQSNSIPLYLQVKNKIKQEIRSGILKAGDKLDSEAEMQKEYGMSRVTVRNAMAELEREGYIIKVQGKGSFVAQSDMLRLPVGVTSFTGDAKMQGADLKSKILKVGLEPVKTEMDKEFFGINDGENILIVKRLRCVNNVPLLIEENHLSAELEGLMNEDLTGSLYAILQEKYHMIPSIKGRRSVKIIFATGNEHKMIEIRAILSDLGVEILSQKEAGIKADVIEDGMTFEENAMIKATEIAKIAHEMPEYAHAVVLADDSGLEIDYLNKEPGIYSARYMGEDTSYDIKNQALLDRLDGVPDEKRTARFVCAIAAAMPDGSCEVVRGTMEGIIGHKIAGENGFGYDPIFFLPEYGCTSAELSPEKKNELSHRGEGLKKIRKILEQR